MSAVRIVCGAFVGAVLGFVAWGEGRAPVVALLLPLVAATAASRGQAFAVGCGYAASTLRYGVPFVAAWFDGQLAVGAAAVAVYSLISGGVWCVAWTRVQSPTWRAVVVLVAWLVALLPPAGAGVAGHPVIAAGYLAPNTAWLGVAGSAGIPAAAVWIFAAYNVPRRLQLAGLAAAAVALGSLGLAVGSAPVRSVVNGIHAAQTAFGPLREQDEAIQRIERIGRVVPPDKAVVVIWPESVIGRYDTAMYQVLNLEVLAPARAGGRVQVIGMDLPLPGERLLNSAVAFYTDGSTATATARQPAPVSLWKPWRSNRTFVADWTAHNMLSLGQGDRAAVIFCYEEYVPILYLLNEFRDAPTVYLAMANTWATPHSSATAIQTAHSLGMARLFGRPYLKAENRPVPVGLEAVGPALSP